MAYHGRFSFNSSCEKSLLDVLPLPLEERGRESMSIISSLLILQYRDREGAEVIP